MATLLSSQDVGLGASREDCEGLMSDEASTPSPHETERPVTILLVEDSPTDRFLAVEAFERTSYPTDLRTVIDGVEALAYLRRQGPYAAAPRPDLILLDWNLPRKSGRDVLSEIKWDEELRRIPVVVLTTSDDERDVMRSYEMRANCFVTKPADFAAFEQAVHEIRTFWFDVARLPRKGRQA